MALAALSSGIAVATHSSMKSANLVEPLSLTTRLANALVSYAAYLGQSFCPVDLAPFYPHPSNHVPIASVAGSLLLLVAITAAAAYCWRRRPYVLVGWLWFLGMLVPVIGLVSFGTHARADRYMYLSQIGLSIALAWGVWSVYQSRQSRQAESWRRWMLAAVSGGTILLLAAVAWLQTSYWRDAETLWTHTLACTERNALAHYHRAFLFNRQGKTEEAITHLRETLAIGSIDLYVIEEAHALFESV